MLRRNLVMSTWCRIRKREMHKSINATKLAENSEKSEISNIRNIGVMAHIDAGKFSAKKELQNK